MTSGCLSESDTNFRFCGGGDTKVCRTKSETCPITNL